MTMNLLLHSLVALGMAVLSASSAACKCSAPSGYDAVFEGRAEHIKINPAEPRQYSEVRFTTTWSQHGPAKQEITVYSPAPVLMCGVSFQTGKTYRVYARLVEGRHETLDCYPTKEK
jgi:hypothetical protein